MLRLRRNRLKAGWRRVALPVLLAAAMVSGCADFYRTLGVDERPPASDDRAARQEEEDARLEKQLAGINEKIQEMSATVDRNSKTIAVLSEKLAAQEATNGNRDRRRLPNGMRPEQSAECAWIGQRTITVLLNDDLIAAEGFTRLYGDFLCPMEHLAQAFACAVPTAQQKDRALLEAAPATPKPGETTESAAVARREAQLAGADRRDKRIAACWKQLKAE